MSEVRENLEQALKFAEGNNSGIYHPQEAAQCIREALALLDASEQEQTDGIVSAFEAVQRAITAAVGDGAPSGPYWEDGVRLLQQRAETAQAALSALRFESEAKLEAARLKQVALQDTIDGCAKRVAELVRRQQP